MCVDGWAGGMDVLADTLHCGLLRCFLVGWRDLRFQRAARAPCPLLPSVRLTPACVPCPYRRRKCCFTAGRRAGAAGRGGDQVPGGGACGDHAPHRPAHQAAQGGRAGGVGRGGCEWVGGRRVVQGQAAVRVCAWRGAAAVILPASTHADLLQQPACLPLLRLSMHACLSVCLLAPQAEGGPGAEAAIKARERQLAPVYHQVAIQFAQVGEAEADEAPAAAAIVVL